jgi:hypothetical protein
VTDWRRSFRAALFNAWREAGLPDPGRHELAYDELRVHAAPPPVARDIADGPLHPDTIRSVHGFGYVMGVVFASLLDSPGRRREVAADWCGRFNLGISLLDWLCDEAAVAPAEIADLPALARLRQRSSSRARIDHPAAGFLNSLADDLLIELTRDAGPPRAGEPRSALWPSLRRLMRAELTAAEPGFFEPANPRAALPALRLKSVEPFRIMAERTSLAGDPCSAATCEIARRAGRAVGECVWLADDADDLWRDLDTGSGNRFIAEAAAADPRVLAADDATVVDLALLRVLTRERIGERLAARAVRRLVRELRRAPCDQHDRERAAGLVAVALARWAT